MSATQKSASRFSTLRLPWVFGGSTGSLESNVPAEAVPVRCEGRGSARAQDVSLYENAMVAMCITRKDCTKIVMGSYEHGSLI